MRLGLLIQQWLCRRACSACLLQTTPSNPVEHNDRPTSMPIDLTQSNFPSRKSAVFINPPTLETVKIRPRETANTGGRTTILQPHSLNTLPCSSFGLASYPDSSQHCDPFDNFFSSDGHIPQCAEPVVPLPQRPGMAAGGFALARPMLQTALKRSPILKTKLDLGDSLSNSCIYSQNSKLYRFWE